MCEAQDRILFGFPGWMQSRLIRSPIETLDDSIWQQWAVLDEEIAHRCRQAGTMMNHQNAMIAAYANSSQLTDGIIGGDFTANDPIALDVLKRSGVVMPLLRYTKREALSIGHQGGYGHLLKMTWSCEGDNSVAMHGPCGLCDPCRERLL